MAAWLIELVTLALVAVTSLLAAAAWRARDRFRITSDQLEEVEVLDERGQRWTSEEMTRALQMTVDHETVVVRSSALHGPRPATPPPALVRGLSRRRAQRPDCQGEYHRDTAIPDARAEDLSVEDILLLLAAGADGPYALDPIRVMKGAFIVSQAGRPEWRGQFHFRPYDYGPLDSEVYSVRDRLVTNRLLRADRSRRYETYRLTPAGGERVADLERRFGEDAEWVKRVGHYVSSKSFSSLLEEIYERWPEFAARSVIKQ